MGVDLKKPLLALPELHDLCASPARSATITPVNVDDLESLITLQRQRWIFQIMLPTYAEAKKAWLVSLCQQVYDSGNQLNIPVRRNRNKYQFIVRDQNCPRLVPASKITNPTKPMVFLKGERELDDSRIAFVCNDREWSCRASRGRLLRKAMSAGRRGTPKLGSLIEADRPTWLRDGLSLLFDDSWMGFWLIVARC